MQRSLILCILAVFVQIFADDISTFQAAESEASSSKPFNDDNECSLRNLEKLIKHTDFSIVGKKSDCEFFYFTGQDIQKPTFNLDMYNIIKKSECKSAYKPLFYTEPSKKLRLSAGFKNDLYLINCNWQQTDTYYHSCFLNQTTAERQSLENPTNTSEIDEVIGLFSNPKEGEIHMVYENEKAQFFDGTYDVGDSRFVKNIKIASEISAPLAYDPDMHRLYFGEKNKYFYLDVIDNGGIMNYSTSPVPLAIKEKKYKAISFSHNFYIAKEMTAGDDYCHYYAGKIGSLNQECILKTKDRAIVLELFVKGGMESVYNSIFESFEPLQTTTPFISTTATQHPTTKSSSSVQHCIYLTFFLIFVAHYMK